MQAHFIKWFGPSTLAAAALWASSSAQSAESVVPVPSFTAQPCCQLCPAASDAKQYVTPYQQNFATIEQSQGEWLFRTVQDLRTSFETTPEGYKRLRELREAFKAKGIELVVVDQPTRGLVNREKLTPAQKASFNYDLALSNYKALLNRFNAMGYTTVDLSPLSDEKLPADQADQDFYFRGDQHWTPYGAEKTARLVADVVKKMPAFAGIPRREFESHKIGRMGKKGTLNNFAGQLCGTSYSIQYIDQFATEPKGESSGADLFNNTTDPQIALVGTSHSGKNYNFSGYLQQYIGADILNVALPGGGLEGAMVEYLASDDFQKHPPKILIWEFSPMYRLDQESVYQQIMALLDNGCQGKPAVMSASLSLKHGNNTVLVNGKGTAPILNLRNGDNQIDIQYADHSVKELHGMLWFMNGRHEPIKFTKPTASETNGRFTFNLRDDEDWANQQLLALELQGPGYVSPDAAPVAPAKPGTAAAPAAAGLPTSAEADQPDPTDAESDSDADASPSQGTPLPGTAAPKAAPAPPDLTPQPVQVTLCKRNNYPHAAVTTAQAGL